MFLRFLFLWQSIFRISDAAISSLLSFMVKFLSIVARCLKVDNLFSIVSTFPQSLHRAKGFLSQLSDDFVKYVSCPSCHSLYSLEESIEFSSTGEKLSRFCSYVRYPEHSQARMRQPCGQKLLKTLRSSKGSEYLSPLQTICFRSIIDSLKELPWLQSYVKSGEVVILTQLTCVMYMMVKCGNTFSMIPMDCLFLLHQTTTF